MSDELLIYTPKITPRISYIFKHIFVRILNIPIKFTATIEEFVAFEGLKMSYAKAPLANEYFIQSHGLLIEQGIHNPDIVISQWESTPCFFNTGVKSKIPFDIFSASFYLLSRYEEYLPSVLDENHCFPAEESIAFKNNFLDKPLIDIWAYKMLKSLKEIHPEYHHEPKKYEFISTFSINQTYLYKGKGLIRSLFGAFNDFFTLQLFRFWTRMATLLTIKEDPYDTYDQIIAYQKQYNVKTIFFFLLSNYTTYDNNISYTRRRYTLLIKSIADYAKVGLLNSYFTMNDEELMKKECKRLENVINTPVKYSRQHYGRNQLPDTYNKLVDLNIEEDYTMGYPKHLGFKASTCTPFYFYDLNFEIQVPLKVFPNAFNDIALRFDLQLSPKQALMRVNHLANMVKQVNGTLIGVFHNDSLSDFGEWKYWGDFYEKVLQSVKEN